MFQFKKHQWLQLNTCNIIQQGLKMQHFSALFKNVNNLTFATFAFREKVIVAVLFGFHERIPSLMNDCYLTLTLSLYLEDLRQVLKHYHVWYHTFKIYCYYSQEVCGWHVLHLIDLFALKLLLVQEFLRSYLNTLFTAFYLFTE